MRLSESWLREFVDPPVSTAELVSQLTMAGLEVDSVEPAAGEFSLVVVGEVVSLIQHPNADKLKVCQIDVGQAEHLQIVCGANNVRQGLKVPAALVGASLPGGIKIKKTKLRGEVSCGMLCSQKELGLSDAAEGLLELSASAPLGVDLREYFALKDSVIEVDLTPNRADCLSVEGIAREVAVLNNMSWRSAAFEPPAISSDQTVDIAVEQPDCCPVYLGRVVRDVNAGAETPLWMQEKLRRAGIRSLGPLVDVTNFVLLEMGQPLHAFDAEKLSGGIIVRKSRCGESLELLNEQTVTLDEDTLIIADQQRPLALAGIMGGNDSAVGDETSCIFLECAFFSPLAIAGKARQYGLHTDSSHRFERGVDFTLQQRALDRATQLILAICGGAAGPVNRVNFPEYFPQRVAVKLRDGRLKKMLGIDVANDRVSEIFSGLGMQVNAVADGLEVIPPGYRFDIAIEADLLEEVGRIYGYNNLPNNKLSIRTDLGSSPEARLPLDRIKDLLVDRGYQEAISYSFVAESLQQLLSPDDDFVRLKNPLSADMAVMRTTLWCGLITSALHNINRQQSRVRLFESGLRFLSENDEVKQQAVIGGLASGFLHREQWGEKARKIDFFDIKSDLEAIFSLNGGKITYKCQSHPALHPGQSARLYNHDGIEVGWLGMLHPALEKKLGFDHQVYLFEMDLAVISQKRLPVFSSLSKYPSVKRDLAVIVEEAISADEIIRCIQQCDEALIQSICFFDIYRGAGVAEGFKSVALSLTLQDFSQTLEDFVIDAILNKVLRTLETDLGAKLRG